MRFFAYHGCLDVEREKGQKFEVNVELTGNLQKPGKTDDLNNTYDFNTIYRIVSDTMRNTRYNLMEALGEEICGQLLKQFPGLQVKLTLRKPDPPINGSLDCVEIELIRG